ncbi:MAG: hypothetical protein ALAOOOJD_02543 [bacterium]|nr:hypothetical protein [bacterium]
MQRRQGNVIEFRAGLFNFSQCQPQRMGGAHFVVTVGADQKKIVTLGICGERLQQQQRRGIRPLQIVQENNERMLLLRENLNKTLEDQIETVLRFRRWQLRNCRLRTENQLDFRNNIDDDLAVGTERLRELVFPRADLRFALRQKLPH